MSGKPAARQGDMTQYGGSIVQGSAGVRIGAPTGVACSVCPGGVTSGHPVNPLLGAKVLPGETDIALPGPLPFILSRTYSSYRTKTPAPVGSLGPGWKMPADIRLQLRDNTLILSDNGGRSLYGRSLYQESEREYQCSATGLLPLRWVMCCSKEYKYIYHYNGGYEELYKRDAPDRETRNLLLEELGSEEADALRRLKEQAIAYEKQWGPDGTITGGSFAVCPQTTVHPCVRGKYHVWANTQHQFFYEKEGDERIARLQEETLHALQSDTAELFPDPEWLESYEKGCERYRSGNRE